MQLENKWIIKIFKNRNLIWDRIVGILMGWFLKEKEKVWNRENMGRWELRRNRWRIIDEIIGIEWGFGVRDIFTDYTELRTLRLIFLLSNPRFFNFRLCKKAGIWLAYVIC